MGIGNVFYGDFDLCEIYDIQYSSSLSYNLLSQSSLSWFARHGVQYDRVAMKLIHVLASKTFTKFFQNT